ncbi:MAG TPA: phage holin family protein [Casimicrobiaceae bacterium]|nr:phage holin family protein [Casimicrobiaceae bacterium]
MAEPGAERPAAGFATALSGIAATLVGLLRTRLELATVEFEEEREYVKTMLVLIVVATVFACFALVAFSVLVVIWLWDRYPLAAVAGVAIAYAVIAAGAAWSLKRRLVVHGRPFAVTLSELERDAESLGRKP